MSSETNVSKKVVVAIINKRGPQVFSNLLKQYRKVRGDDEITFADLRDAIKELSTGDEPQLSVIQFKLPEDDKFKFMVFPIGTEFVVPEIETADEDDSADLDALEAEAAASMFDVTEMPLSDDLFSGYLVLGQNGDASTTTADFVTSKLQAQANFLKHVADMGVENVQLFGAVPLRFRIDTYAVPAAQLRAVEDEEDGVGIGYPATGEADIAVNHTTAAAVNPVIAL